MNIYDINGNEIMSNSDNCFFDNVLHRGWTDGVPDNTLPAFYLTVVNGYKWAECDIRMSSDSIPVLSHNATITGTVDDVETTLTIANSTAEEIKKLVLQTHAKYGEIKVSTLSELLDMAKYINLGIVIDFKAGGGLNSVDNNKIVAKTVLESGWSKHCIYMPLDTNMATAIQSIDKNASFDFVKSGITSVDGLGTLDDYKTLLTGANTVNFNIQATVKDSEGGLPSVVFDTLRENGLGCSFWGVNANGYSTYMDKSPSRICYQYSDYAYLGKKYCDDKKNEYDLKYNK